MLELKVAKGDICDTGKSKSQLKTDIPAITDANQPANGPDKPHLCHTHDRAKYAEAEGAKSGKGWRKLRRLIVLFWIVGARTLLEDEMLWEGDAFIDGQPVALGMVSSRIFHSGRVQLTMINIKSSRTDSKCE